MPTCHLRKVCEYVSDVPHPNCPQIPLPTPRSSATLHPQRIRNNYQNQWHSLKHRNITDSDSSLCPFKFSQHLSCRTSFQSLSFLVFSYLLALSRLCSSACLFCFSLPLKLCSVSLCLPPSLSRKVSCSVSLSLSL